MKMITNDNSIIIIGGGFAGLAAGTGWGAPDSHHVGTKAC